MSEERPSVLVTGASGLLGCSLTPALQAAGYGAVRLGRQEGMDCRVDLCDRPALHAELDARQPRFIINLAALTDVDRCQRDPQQAYLGNVRPVENIAAWIAARGKACRLLQISSDQVYDGPGPHEEDRVSLGNLYAFSKYAGELAAQRVDATVLRTNFFGPSRCAGRQSLSDWLTMALGRGEEITVFEDVMFSPLHIDSLVAEIVRVLGRPRPGVFNLGAQTGMSKADFAFRLAGELGLSTDSMSRGRLSERNLYAYRPGDMRMDCSRYQDTYDCRLPTLVSEIARLGVA